MLMSGRRKRVADKAKARAKATAEAKAKVAEIDAKAVKKPLPPRKREANVPD